MFKACFAHLVLVIQPQATSSAALPAYVLELASHQLLQVYAIAFNNPFGDKVVTGSFDKTAKLWDANTGQCLHTLRGTFCMTAPQ